MYHFPTKADLWVAVAQDTIDAFLERFHPRFEALEGLDPASKLRIVFQDYVRFAAEQPELHKLMVDASVCGEPDLAGVVETRLRPVFELLCGEIEAAQKAGTMLPGDPVLLYYSLVGVAATVFSLRREVELLTGRDPREPETVEAQASLLAQLFFPVPRAGRQREQKNDD
jgi:AcrR family transcriptional regulator